MAPDELGHRCVGGGVATISSEMVTSLETAWTCSL